MFNVVIGLDPARPFFEIPETPEKLDPTDANFVDVIHTCAGLLGFFEATGHADFYPNNGIPPQPGCQGLQGYMGECLVITDLPNLLVPYYSTYTHTGVFNIIFKQVRCR